MSNADLYRKAYSLGASHAVLDSSELIKTALRMDPRLMGALGGAAIGGATGAAVDDKNRWRGGALGAVGGAALGAGGGHLYQNAGKGAKATRTNVPEVVPAAKTVASTPPSAPTPTAVQPAPVVAAKPQPGKLSLPAQPNAPGQVLPPPVKAQPPRVKSQAQPNDPAMLTRSPQLEWGEKSIASRKPAAVPAPVVSERQQLESAATMPERRANKAIPATGSRGKFINVDQAMQHKLLQGRDPAEVRSLIEGGLVPHSAVDVDWALRQRAALGNNPEAIRQAAAQWHPISPISDDPWQKRYLMSLVPQGAPGKMVSASYYFGVEKCAADRCAALFGV